MKRAIPFALLALSASVTFAADPVPAAVAPKPVVVQPAAPAAAPAVAAKKPTRKPAKKPAKKARAKHARH